MAKLSLPKSGAGSVGSQTPTGTVYSIAWLLEMDISSRCVAFTMAHAKELAKEHNLVLIDGVGGSISFIGTQGELNQRAVSARGYSAPGSRMSERYLTLA